MWKHKRVVIHRCVHTWGKSGWVVGTRLSTDPQDLCGVRTPGVRMRMRRPPSTSSGALRLRLLSGVERSERYFQRSRPRKPDIMMRKPM